MQSPPSSSFCVVIALTTAARRPTCYGVQPDVFASPPVTGNAHGRTLRESSSAVRAIIVACRSVSRRTDGLRIGSTAVELETDSG